MIYCYRCQGCRHEFEVIKSVARIDDPEPCPECSSEETGRYLTPCSFFGEKVEDAEYNPALGCIVRDSKHRKQLAKERNLIEIGNESPEKYCRDMDRDREKRIQSRYDDIMDTSLTTVSK
jgi:putative FmdB family regulatory protein